MATTEQAVRDGLAAFRLGGIMGEVDVPTRIVYVRGLRDVPADVVAASVDRLLRTPRRFHITLPEWLEACAAVIEERRALLARQAAACMARCPECLGTGWSHAEGPNAVLRCGCHARARALMAEAAAPISRPALPPHEGAE